jgi:hypothetical protein
LRFEKEQLNFVDDPPITNLDFELDVDLQPISRLQRWRRYLGVVNSFM